MDIREPAFIHRKPGPAKPLLPARAPHNPYVRKVVPIREHSLNRMSELGPPRCEAGCASSGAGSLCRCREKGCVFPADRDGTGICRQHRRERCEPTLFASLQVTGLLLDAAKLGLPNSKRDLARQRDRRRLEATRQRFLEELA
jgi:hypothetical protein